MKQERSFLISETLKVHQSQQVIGSNQFTMAFFDMQFDSIIDG